MNGRSLAPCRCVNADEEIEYAPTRTELSSMDSRFMRLFCHPSTLIRTTLVVLLLVPCFVVSVPVKGISFTPSVTLTV